MLTKLLPTTERNYNIISLDTEADENGDTYVYCVAGFYQKKQIREVFHSRAACVKYLFHRKWYNTILTGLNLAFDLNTLYGVRDGFNWECINNMGKLITASPSKAEKKKRGFTKKHQYLKIIDLGNFIQNMSLKQMGGLFGYSAHIDKHILGRDGDKKELAEACLSHCLTGVHVMNEIQHKIHDLGGTLKITGSSTALDLYRRQYLPKEGQIYDFFERGETEGEKKEREEKVKYVKKIGKLAYIGGRTEAFKLGLYNNCIYLDINSSYPSQMDLREFPDINSYKRYTKNLSVDFLKELLENEEGQAFVRVQTPKMLIPFLHSNLENGKLIFPTGTLTNWYTYPELRYALKLGYKILDVYEIASFRRVPGKTLFGDYVPEMMKYKATCKPVAKLLANGLSGKFGQQVPEDDNWTILDSIEDIKIDNERYFSINGQIWKYEPAKEVREEFEFVNTAYPLIIAYVTAYGRIQEHETIMTIGPENVYYMDTDSIIADRSATLQAIDSGLIKIDKKELGAYDIEHDNITVDIRGEKYYRFHDSGKTWTYHIKGVPGYVSADYWLHRCAAYYRPVKIKTALRTGQKVNKFIRIYHSDKTKPEKRIYHHRGSEPLKIDD